MNEFKYCKNIEQDILNKETGEITQRKGCIYLLPLEVTEKGGKSLEIFCRYKNWRKINLEPENANEGT